MGKVLVSGGLGYIGSHTVVELQESGFDVIIVDDLSNSKISVLDGITKITGIKPIFEQIDLKDQAQTTSLLQKYKPSDVIHFAAYKSVKESILHPLQYYHNNLLSLINLLMASQQVPLDNFIFSSSCTVYGQADTMPITEKFPWKKTDSPYGYTKQVGERILMDFIKAYQKKAISLRYFNPIGAHPSAEIGELPRGIPDNLVPYITQTAAGLREKLYIYGNDYPTPDGTAIRDYIYVCDLAKAHVAALRKIDTIPPATYQAYNLGTGKGNSVLEVIHSFEKTNHIKLPYDFAPRRPGDITEAYADCSKAFQELEWKSNTPLTESLKTAWEWQKKLINS